MAELQWWALCLPSCLTQSQAIFSLDLPEIYHTLYLFKTMTEKAERINGLAAMIGIVAAIGAYALTGDIIPGIF